MPLVDAIAISFNAAKNREDEISSKMQTFWTSNDHFSLSEILPEIKEDKSDSIVNLLVAESDVFSILDKVKGDIIICDIDPKLLTFILHQKDHLLYLYDEYLKKNINFERVMERYEEWLHIWGGTWSDPLGWLTDRISQLGKFHFMYDEENFNKSMSALKRKNIVAININLFDVQEQKNLCDVLNKFQVKVDLFNLTNLPDYDQKNSLVNLMENIPWVEHDPKILWNIHDRGPAYSDRHDMYVHYLFSASSSENYKEQMKIRPEFFANIDKMTLSLPSYKNKDIKKSKLRRYSQDSESLQELYDEKSRETYLKFLAEPADEKSTQDSVKSVCQKFHVIKFPRDRSVMECLKEIENEFQMMRKKTKSVRWSKDIDQLAKISIAASIDSLIRKARTSDLTTQKYQEDMKSEFKNEKNKVLFLMEIANAISNCDQLFSNRFLDSSSLRREVSEFLKSWFIKADSKADSLSTAGEQNRFKFDFIQAIKKFKFTHSIVDEDKNYIIQTMLDEIILVPILGLKYFDTISSFFFNREKSIDESIMERIDNLPVF